METDEPWNSLHHPSKAAELVEALERMMQKIFEQGTQAGWDESEDIRGMDAALRNLRSACVKQPNSQEGWEAGGFADPIDQSRNAPTSD
jgi:hypothetical protein